MALCVDARLVESLAVLSKPTVAIINGDAPTIVDFNDWPSFSRVRDAAARAIARRCLLLLRRQG